MISQNNNVISLCRHVDVQQKNEHFVKFNSMTEEEVEELQGTRFDLTVESPQEEIKYVI